MLSMYDLRTHVFQQKIKFEETAMAFACDDNISNNNKFSTPNITIAPSAATPSRVELLPKSSSSSSSATAVSILAERDELSATREFKLWCRKRRRRKFLAVDHNCRTKKLLYKFKFHEYNRPLRSDLYDNDIINRSLDTKRTTSVISNVPSAHEPIEERKSIGDAVPGNRAWTANGQSLSANRLCSGAARLYRWRRATSHCLSPLALE